MFEQLQNLLKIFLNFLKLSFIFFFVSIFYLKDGCCNFYFGAGILAPRLNKNSTQNSARIDFKQSFVDEKYFNLMLSFDLELLFYRAQPAFYFTPFGLESEDQGARKRIFAASIPFAYSLLGLLVKFGPGVYYYMVNGNGGTVNLNDGSGTSTFARPGGIKTSSNLFLDSGLSLLVDRARLDLNFWVLAPLSSRRSITGVVQFCYALF